MLQAQHANADSRKYQDSAMATSQVQQSTAPQSDSYHQKVFNMTNPTNIGDANGAAGNER